MKTLAAIYAAELRQEALSYQEKAKLASLADQATFYNRMAAIADEHAAIFELASL